MEYQAGLYESEDEEELAERLALRAECNALFRLIDKDGDGNPSKKEIKAGIAAIKSKSDIAESASKIWKAADADGSKQIDMDEFFELMQARILTVI